jgi:hypothetical protein
LGVASEPRESTGCSKIPIVGDSKSSGTRGGSSKDRTKTNLIDSNGGITQRVFADSKTRVSQDAVSTNTKTKVCLIPEEVGVILSKLITSIDECDRARGKAW